MAKEKTTSSASRARSSSSIPASSNASSAPASALKWRKPDAYHIRSECGRYTVARVNLGHSVDYVAWHVPGAELVPLEIAAARVGVKATEAETLDAIKTMQRACLEHAGAS